MALTQIEDTSYGWRQSSTCRAIEDEGKSAGQAFGLGESGATTLVRVLTHLGRQKFGREDAVIKAKLEALEAGHALAELTTLGERLTTAPDWPSWLGEVVAPTPPIYPDFAKNLEIDFEMCAPSIDTYHRANSPDDEFTFHIRMQKWYQPELDKMMFEEQLKLKRRHNRRVETLVILMWPSADGPEITGQYVGPDESGAVQSFKYILKKAWEMEPEDTYAGISTMMLTPLTRGAKERMPELFANMRQLVKKQKVKAETLNVFWTCIYWTMGIVLEKDRVEAIMADLMPGVRTSKDYRSSLGHAFEEAYGKATTEGPAIALRELIARVGTVRFGSESQVASRLEAIDSADELEAKAKRLTTAMNWEEMLA